MDSDHAIDGQAGPWRVEFVAETGSTNTDLMAAAEAGASGDRTALRTDHQTSGRGRLDRRWDAPPGSNLLVSLLFTVDVDDPTRLTHAVGVAAVRAVERCADEALDGRLGLKWPNDLLLDGRKLAGILAQRSGSTGAVVVGIGLNVGWAPKGAASMAGDLGVEVTPDLVLRHLLEEFDRLAAGAVLEEYRRRLLTIGRRVRIELAGDRNIVGEALDVDHAGRLVVDVDGTRTVVDVGDVVHLRPA